MIVILHGDYDPPRNMRMTRQVEEWVHVYEHGPTIQARKEGYFELTLTDVSYLEEDGRTTIGKQVTGEKRLGSLDIFISPLLNTPENGQLRLGDFPDNYIFGNGCTGPKRVRMRRVTDTGNVKLWDEHVSTLVFPTDTTLDADKLDYLRELVEGTPPGSKERNIWEQFDENGERPLDSKWVAIDGKMELR